MAKKPQKAAPDARHYDVVLAPHITEKSTMLSEHNSVVFKVAADREQAGDQGRRRGAVRGHGDGRQHNGAKGKTKKLEGHALRRSDCRKRSSRWPKA